MQQPITNQKAESLQQSWKKMENEDVFSFPEIMHTISRMRFSGFS